MLLFTSYKSYYSPTSFLLHPLQLKIQRREGYNPFLLTLRGQGKCFPSECFARGFNGFLKSSIIYRSPAPPPFLDQQKAEFVIAGGQSCRNFTKVPATISKLPMLGAGTEWQEHVPIRGPKHLGPGVTRACPHHFLARRSLKAIPNRTEGQLGENLLQTFYSPHVEGHLNAFQSGNRKSSVLGLFCISGCKRPFVRKASIVWTIALFFH